MLETKLGNFYKTEENLPEFGSVKGVIQERRHFHLVSRGLLKLKTFALQTYCYMNEKQERTPGKTSKLGCGDAFLDTAPKT